MGRNQEHCGLSYWDMNYDVHTYKLFVYAALRKVVHKIMAGK